MNYNRKIPATKSHENGFKRLTNKQMSVYYWLISRSYWNSLKKENHYYIYSEDAKISQIRKDLGIKSDKTVRSALNTLEAYGYICRIKELIYIPHREYYTYLNIRLIKFLLKWSISIGSELILFYSMLKRVFEINNKRDTKTIFNVPYMMKLLGYPKTDSVTHKKFQLYIALMQHYNLIKTKNNYVTNSLGKKCTTYTLESIEEDITIECEYAEGDLNIEPDEVILKELRKSLE